MLDTLIRVAHDCSEEQFLACVESALCERKLSLAGVPVLFASLPRRFHRLRELIDPLAESGLETLARLRLRRFVRSIRSQVTIAGIAPGGRSGRVDLLLDGWLVIELDGDKFHDPIVDREQNAILVRLGYRVHRFGYTQVIHGWEDMEATIRELLRYVPLALTKSPHAHDRRQARLDQDGKFLRARTGRNSSSDRVRDDRLLLAHER